jgi:adenine deaminase
LLEEGHIDHLVRMAMEAGLDPITVIRMATLNAVEAFGLRDRGAIGPGRRADLVVTPTLEAFRAALVFSGGALVAQEGVAVGPWPEPEVDDRVVRSSIHVDLEQLSFRIPAAGSKLRVVGLIPDQVLTEMRIMEAAVVAGEAVADVSRDLLKLATVERHHNTGNVGLGFVQGLGLKQGAIAGSVGHDCHNITVAGVDDASMRAAVRAVKELGGGLVAVLGEQLLGSVSLPIGGLMSDQPVESVRAQLDVLLEAVRVLGSPLHDPFMQLGFLALEVIPRLKLTDLGLVDVDKFDFVPLWVE